MKERKWTKICIGIYGLLAAVYFISKNVLRNYVYSGYAVFYLFKYILLCLPIIYFLCVGVSNLRRYKMRYPDRSIAGGRALLIMYALAVIPVCVFLAFKCEILEKPEINPAFLIHREVKQDTAQKEAEQDENRKQTEQEEPLYQDPETRTYGKVEDAYHQLYDEVLAISYPSSKDCYNAKGNFYALLQEGVTEYEGKRVPYRITMVYDRISDDGNSHMFVNYREYMTEEGTVTEFGLEYYVNMDTGEVKAEEAPWGN